MEYLFVGSLTIDPCDSAEKVTSHSAPPAAEGSGDENPDRDEFTKELEACMEEEMGMNSSDMDMDAEEAEDHMDVDE